MQNIDQFIFSFEKKVLAVKAGEVTNHTYGRDYFVHLQQNLRYYLHIYAEVLQLTIKKISLAPAAVTLVDYGAGNGLLGLFAKHCGFGRVYINDIEQNFLKAAENLSALLQIPVDGFIAGDIEAVAHELSQQPPQAVVGTDVIEHIYDLDNFFKKLQVLNPQLVTVFTTAANTANWFKTRHIKKLQLKDEYEGGQPGDYTLFGSAPLAPFFIMRKRIIKEYFPLLSETEIEELATHTRGLNKESIINAVTKYTTDKKLPALISHPTNTCDPLTGSWTEHLLTVEEYKTIYNGAGYKLTVYNGFYNSYAPGAKALLMNIANTAIKLFGKKLAPFIILVGTASKNKNGD
ncbi:class I SAM-dependent methyltransferase [Ferruginibacter sp.]